MLKTTLLKTALCAGALAAAGLSATAVPLQRADVPAEPAWVVHVDCDGLRGTTVGQYLLGEMNKPETQAKLAAFSAVFNFDPRTQLHGLTLYSTGAAPEEGVLLVYADFDPDRLATLAKAANDYQSTPHNQHAIHSWIDANKKPKNDVRARTYAALFGARVVLFGQREAPVAQALDVLDRAAPSLAGGSTFPQLGAAGGTSFLQAAARKLDLPAKEPNAAIFRLSKSGRLEVGEAQGRATATLTLEANTEEVAKYMTSIGQGLVALMKLQKEKPETAKLAEALSLKQDGAHVVVNLALPATDVIEMMKADAARKAAKKAQKDQAATGVK